MTAARPYPVLTDLVSEFDLAQIMSLRRALEIEAAQQAARNATAEDLVALLAAHQADVEAHTPSDAAADGAPDDTTVAADRIPGRFHYLMFAAANNDLLATFYAGVIAALRPAIDRGDIIYSADALRWRADHVTIYKAIEAEDPMRAAHALVLHCDKFRIQSATHNT